MKFDLSDYEVKYGWLEVTRVTRQLSTNHNWFPPIRLPSDNLRLMNQSIRIVFYAQQLIGANCGSVVATGDRAFSRVVYSPIVTVWSRQYETNKISTNRVLYVLTSFPVTFRSRVSWRGTRGCPLRSIGDRWGLGPLWSDETWNLTGKLTRRKD